MDDNKQNEVDVNSKEIKDEAKNTFDDVKDTIKNVKFQSDAKETTNFVSRIFKDPLGIIKKTADDKGNSNLKHAILLICLWLIAILITSIYYEVGMKFISAGTHFLNVIKRLIEPIIGLGAMSLIVLLNQKDSKKSLTTTFTTVAIASIPTILISVVEILGIFSTQFSYILTPLKSFASAVTIAFVYFAAKSLVNEQENSKFIKTFIRIQLIYFVCYFVFQFLGIYLPML